LGVPGGYSWNEQRAGEHNGEEICFAFGVHCRIPFMALACE
jgi:hypothetical protein